MALMPFAVPEAQAVLKEIALMAPRRGGEQPRGAAGCLLQVGLGAVGEAVRP